MIGRWVAMAMLCTAVSAGAAAPRVYVVKQLNSGAITIDGVLSEPAWHFADSVEFVRAADWEAPQRKTSIRFTWDQAHLYVAMVTQDPDLWGTITARDGSVYTEEAVEFYFDPDGDGVNYAEIDFNCRGTVIDAIMSRPWSAGGSANSAWNAAGMRFAVKARGTIGNQADTDTGLVLEAAFAWSDFSPYSIRALPPRAGDTLRANGYRIEGRTEPKEWSCWSSVETTEGGAFHTPAKFGKLVMSAAGVVSIAAQPGERTGASAGHAQRQGRMVRAVWETATGDGHYWTLDGRRARARAAFDDRKAGRFLLATTR